MAKPETIRVELSAADRRLLQRVVDALERKTPKGRLTEPATGHSVRLTEEQLLTETNPRLMERHLITPPPSVADMGNFKELRGND